MISSIQMPWPNLPANLPFEQPSRYHLIINRKTAQALALTISQTLLRQANEVIQ